MVVWVDVRKPADKAIVEGYRIYMSLFGNGFCSSTHATITEVIRDGKNGLLADFFSSEDLVNAICRVLEHPDQMIEIRRPARRTIVERFDLRMICLPRQIELIETLGH
jgi:hypothetical protein